MQSTILIASVKSDIDLPKKNIERFANYRESKSDLVSSDFKLPGYENVSWRFLSAMASGSVWITNLNRQTNKVVQREIAVSGFFIAVCTRSLPGKYKLQFGISLS